MTTISRTEVDELITTMAGDLHDLIDHRQLDDPLIIGIHSGGVWVAEALRRKMDIDTPIGTLNISFYRDDFSRIGINPQVTPSELPFSLDERDIILVDDVLHTGRTIRAALNEIFDYGRPDSVTLVVLAERNGRELPIQADICGMHLALEPGQHVKLHGPDVLTITIEQDHDD